MPLLYLSHTFARVASGGTQKSLLVQSTRDFLTFSQTGIDLLRLNAVWLSISVYLCLRPKQERYINLLRGQSHTLAHRLEGCSTARSSP